MNLMHLLHAVVCLPILCLALSLKAAPLSTSFTYQGRLSESGLPVQGTYDFRFRLFDAPTKGNLLGSSVINSSVVVLADGLFATEVDFGAGIFDGGARWLDIGVRPAGTTDSFETLSPRQELTPAPYALRAETASWIASSNVAGVISAAQLPANVPLLNGQGILEGIFAGQGAGLTNLNGAALIPGTIPGNALAPGAITALSTPDGVLALGVSSNGLAGLGTGEPEAGLDIQRSVLQTGISIPFEVRDQSLAFRALRDARSVATCGNLLVIGGGQTFYPYHGGLTLVDISTPSLPVLKSQLSSAYTYYSGYDGIWSVALSSNLLVAASYPSRSISFISVTNPAQPVRLIEWQNYGATIQPFSLSLSGDLLAISAYGDSRIDLVSVSNPADPKVLASISTNSMAYSNLQSPGSLALSGNLLAISGRASNVVTLVDISNPLVPMKAAELAKSGGIFTNIHGVVHLALANNLLAIACPDSNAVTLVDVSTPSAPVLRSVIQDGVGGVTTLGRPQHIALSDTQLVVPAMTANAVNGFDVSDPSKPHLEWLAQDGANGASLLAAPNAVAVAGSIIIATSEHEDAFTVISSEPRPVSLVSDGWVGIGTRQPQAALDVIGDVRIDGHSFRVDSLHVSLGEGSLGSGTNSLAAGRQSVASGQTSIALGHRAIASGQSAAAIGYYSTASGDFSLAAGTSANAQGDASVALGGSVVVRGNHSVAIGRYCDVSGEYSAAIGLDHIIAATNSLALGRGGRVNHNGTFLWSDNTTWPLFESTGSNQFLIRAAGGVGINTNNPMDAALSVVGRVRLNDSPISFRAGSDTNHGLAWFSAGAFASGNPDGPVLFGYGGGALGSANGTPNLSLAWDNTGRVMIDPQNSNSGKLLPGLTFGLPGSGEGISSKRTAGGNELGLDFYTGHDVRLSIANNGNVGIGTASPTVRLEVAGTLKAAAFQGNGNALSNLDAAQLAGSLSDARLSSNVALRNASQTFTGANTFSGTVTTSGSLQANTNVFMNNHDLQLRGDRNHGLGYYGAAKLFGGVAPDGPALYGFSGGILGTKTGSGTNVAVFWNNAGAVGIGTSSPLAATLDVEGELRLNDYALWLRNSSDRNHGLSWYSSGTFAAGNPDGPVLFGCGGGALGTACSVQRLALIWNASGNVGIGRSPAANRFEVEGNASKTAAGDWLANSDARIKTDIATITNALEKLERVRLVAFRYSDDYRALHSGIEDRPYLNVIAQEFQEVFPEHVKGSGEHLADGQEILQVDPWPITIYSAAAVQELKRKLDEKDAEVKFLQQRLDRLEQLLMDNKVGQAVGGANP